MYWCIFVLFTFQGRQQPLAATHDSCIQRERGAAVQGEVWSIHFLDYCNGFVERTKVIIIIHIKLMIWMIDLHEQNKKICTLVSPTMKQFVRLMILPLPFTKALICRPGVGPRVLHWGCPVLLILSNSMFVTTDGEDEHRPHGGGFAAPLPAADWLLHLLA